MRKILVTLSSLLILTACTANTLDSSQVPAKTKSVKLGVLMPLSGDAAAYGIDMQKVFDYELDQINQKAAKKGYKFELVYEDGKCSGVDAVNGFQKLVDIDGVDFVIGGACSSETLAVAPIAESNKVVLISPLSSNPDVEKEGDYTFTLSYSDALIGQGLAAELNKYDKVAMITEQNDFNVGLQNAVKANLDSDTKLVADEMFPKGGTDFRNVLEKAVSQNPEAILLNPNPGVTAINLLKQAAEIPALKDMQLIGQVTYLPDPSREEVGAFAEDMVIVDAPTLTSPALGKISQAIEAAKGKIEMLGLYYTASSLDAIDVLTTTILEKGPDAAKVKDALRKNTYKGYIGTIYFGEYNFVQDIPVSRYVVTDGKSILQP